MSTNTCAALSPCPFCGSEATLDDERLLWVVHCSSCGACVLGDRAPEPEEELPESYWEPFRQSAVDNWNRRLVPPPAPEPPAEALAARPLLEQVARLGDCIGANTVGQIMAISSRAAAWPGRESPRPPGCD